MNTSISFNCMHCNESIDADKEFAGKEASCPGCNRAIVVPKDDSPVWEAFLSQYPDLRNRSDKELESSLGFVKEYTQIYCEIQPTDEQHIRVISIAFKEGVGTSMVKRYDNATFAGHMQGSQKDSKKLQDALFSNKKLNKELNKIMNLSGIKLKKKGLFGIFG